VVVAEVDRQHRQGEEAEAAGHLRHPEEAAAAVDLLRHPEEEAGEVEDHLMIHQRGEEEVAGVVARTQWSQAVVAVAVAEEAQRRRRWFHSRRQTCWWYETEEVASLSQQQ
jgi:hypothetical protein